MHPLPWRQIESLDALPHLDEIIEVSDAVMVARSDLGAQVPFENVPSIQVRAAAAAVKLLFAGAVGVSAGAQ